MLSACLLCVVSAGKSTLVEDQSILRIETGIAMLSTWMTMLRSMSMSILTTSRASNAGYENGGNKRYFGWLKLGPAVPLDAKSGTEILV